MLQHRAVKKLRKMVESEVFFPFLPRHREHFMLALCNLFQYNGFQIIYLCIWVFCWYSFIGKDCIRVKVVSPLHSLSNNDRFD